MTEEDRIEGRRQEVRFDKRRSNQLWIRVSLAVMAGGFALMAFSASWVVVRSANERQQICMASAKEREVLREVIEFARDSTLARPDLDATERHVVRIFYNGALNRAPSVECTNGSIERR